MDLRAHGTRRNRSYRIEALEDRSLLSAAVLSHMPAPIQVEKAAVARETLKGTILGMFTLSGENVAFGGRGTLGTTGDWNLTGHYKVSENHKTHKLTVSGGTATATDAAGDTINLKFTGSGKGTSTFRFSFKGKVSGGTGQFHGATGTFNSSASASAALGIFAESVKIKVK
jgi:hypothetical protein